MTSGRVDQATVPGALRNHAGRLAILEALVNLGVQAVYCVGVTGATLPDSGVEVPVNLQGGVSSLHAPALTDTPAVYEIGTMTTGLFAGTTTLQINAQGLYAAFISVGPVSGEETNSTPQSQSLAIQVEGPATFSESGMNFGGSLTHSIYGKQDVLMLWAIGAEGPELVGIGLQNLRGGGGDVNVQVYLLVVRLGQTNMSDLAVLA